MRKSKIWAFVIMSIAASTLNISAFDNSNATETSATPAYVIVGSGINKYGTGSAYLDHTFNLEGSDATITEYHWRFYMKNKSGAFVLESTSSTPEFSIDAIQSPEDNYYITESGILEGKLECDYTVSGVKYSAVPINISLELRPFIEYAVIDRIEDNAPLDSYNAYYTVKYLGTDRIKISVEEEYSSMVVSKYINEPFIASGVAEQITAPFYAWIDFTAENKYGKYVYTIELLPYGVVSDNSGPADDFAGVRSVGIDEPTDCRYEVYDISGIYLGQFAELSDIRNIPAKGILIVRRISKNNIETFKFLNK